MSLALRLGLVLVCAIALAVAGLETGSRSFVADQGLHITSPAPLATVSVPFTMAWSGPHKAGRRYGVFVDSTPIAPGRSLRDMATQQCKRLPGCQPSASYLAGLGVYVSSSDQLTVPTLEPVGGVAGREGHPVHTARVVVLDFSGRRVGDAAWEVEFRA